MDEINRLSRNQSVVKIRDSFLSQSVIFGEKRVPVLQAGSVMSPGAGTKPVGSSTMDIEEVDVEEFVSIDEEVSTKDDVTPTGPRDDVGPGAKLQ